jgi:hypothetical protein
MGRHPAKRGGIGRDRSVPGRVAPINQELARRVAEPVVEEEPGPYAEKIAELIGTEEELERRRRTERI